MTKVSLLSGKNRAFIAIQKYSKDLVDGHAPDASKLRYLTQRCFDHGWAVDSTTYTTDGGLIKYNPVN